MSRSGSLAITIAVLSHFSLFKCVHAEIDKKHEEPGLNCTEKNGPEKGKYHSTTILTQQEHFTYMLTLLLVFLSLHTLILPVT